MEIQVEFCRLNVLTALQTIPSKKLFNKTHWEDGYVLVKTEINDSSVKKPVKITIADYIQSLKNQRKKNKYF